MAKFGQPVAGAANLAGFFGPSIAQERGAIRNITDADFDFVMAVNVKGLLDCLRAELPHMLEGSQAAVVGPLSMPLALLGS